jgi:uncharacterized membrane protein
MDHHKKIVAGSLILVLFILIVSITSWYVQNEIYTGNVCSCFIPVPILIPLLAAIGLLTGTVIYYMFSPRMERKINKEPVLKLLDPAERKIVEALIRSKGETTQANIVRLTGLQKVKVFRSLEQLRRKGIIVKESNGKTNRIILTEDMKVLT